MQAMFPGGNMACGVWGMFRRGLSQVGGLFAGFGGLGADGLTVVAGVAARVGEVGHGSCDKHCGEGTDDNTEDHCEHKRADSVAAEDEDTEQHEEC